jgi:type III secretion protein U
MSGDSSEEKSLPPSSRKLDDARKKGQISKSADLVGAASMLAAVAVLWSRVPAIQQAWRDIIQTTAGMASDPFDVASRQIYVMLGRSAMMAVLPILGAVVAAAVLAAIIANRGVVFSLEPMIPKLSNLNVFTGLGRIFGMRSLIELLKTLFKAAALTVALIFVVAGTLNSLVRLPTCGDGCVASVFGSMAGYLLAIAGFFFLVVGVIDVLLQRWLFIREMRMTQSEAKREHKDQEGDPHIKSAHRRHRAEAAHAPKVGINEATIVIVGKDCAVALRYVEGETRAPRVVVRVKTASAAAELRAKAGAMVIPIAENNQLARGLTRRIQIGQDIPARHFRAVAQAFYTAGLAR